MKKVITLLLLASMAVSLGACGNNSELEQLRKENEELKQQMQTEEPDSIINIKSGDVVSMGSDLIGKNVHVSGFVYHQGVPTYDEKYGYVTYYLKLSDNEEVQINYSGDDAKTIAYNIYDILEAEGTVTKVYTVKDTILQISCKNMKKTGVSPEKPTEIPLQATPAPVAKEFIKENYGYVDYKDLARNPKQYIGKSLTYSGKVIQVIENGDFVQHRIAVNGDYDNIILVAYGKSLVQSRILENDYVTIYGTSLGLETYESTMGANITIPSILVERIELN